MIRRVTRNEQQQQHVGVQLVTQVATLVRLRPTETAPMRESFMAT
jgi:hypothetical protein